MSNLRYLENKRILFLSWNFYEYPKRIIEKIVELGGNVDFYNSSLTNNILLRKIYRLNRNSEKKYYNNILDSTRKIHYDYLFIINAASFPIWFIEKLTKTVKNAKKVLYVWDSIERFPIIKDSIKYFDVTYTFDLDDAQNNEGMHFLPLFYCDEFVSKNNQSEKYIFSFIGYGYAERYKFIRKVRDFARKEGYSYLFRLYLPSYLYFIYGKYIKKNMEDARLSDFYYKITKQKEICNILESTRIVVDLEQQEQSGLTMRTIETLGMKKKLITTNKNIKKYDFYNPNNILVVDRVNPIISREFVESDFKEVSKDIYEKYSLKAWVEAIFNDEVKGEKFD